MPFKKVHDGLIESELYTDFIHMSTLLMSNRWQNQNGQFTLYTGIVERNFEHDEFVLVVEKQYQTLVNQNTIRFYVNGNDGKCSIEETEGATAKAWKFVKYDGYLQAYQTTDGTTWENIGGIAYTTPILKQGFEVIGSQPLTVSKYTVYKNPFVTVQGYAAGMVAKLISNGSQISDATFGVDNQCFLYIDNPITGSIQVYDDSTLIYQSAELNFKPGDTWANIPILIDVYYDGNILNWNTTEIESLDDTVMLRNNSPDTTYNDITVSIENSDNVTISLDGVTYNTSIVLDTIAPNQMVNLYIHIYKPTGAVFGTQNFELTIKE